MPVLRQAAAQFARFHGVRDQCPRCDSLMRQRAIMLYLREVLRVHETGGAVLHIGPGRALWRWFRSLEAIRYVSFDLDSPRVLTGCQTARCRSRLGTLGMRHLTSSSHP